MKVTSAARLTEDQKEKIIEKFEEAVPDDLTWRVGGEEVPPKRTYFYVDYGQNRKMSFLLSKDGKPQQNVSKWLILH